MTTKQQIYDKLKEDFSAKFNSTGGFYDFQNLYYEETDINLVDKFPSISVFEIYDFSPSDLYYHFGIEMYFDFETNSQSHIDDIYEKYKNAIISFLTNDINYNLESTSEIYEYEDVNQITFDKFYPNWEIFGSKHVYRIEITVDCNATDTNLKNTIINEYKKYDVKKNIERSENSNILKSITYNLGNNLETIKDTIIEITYDSLTSKIANKELIPGQQYKIKDYKAIYVKVDRISEVTEGLYGYNSEVEELICVANSTSSLNKQVISTQYPDHIIYYDPNLETTYEIASINRNEIVKRGTIYYRKDEYGNECPWDFKNIWFNHSLYDYSTPLTLSQTFSATSINNKIQINNYYTSDNTKYLDYFYSYFLIDGRNNLIEDNYDSGNNTSNGCQILGDNNKIFNSSFVNTVALLSTLSGNNNFLMNSYSLSGLTGNKNSVINNSVGLSISGDYNTIIQKQTETSIVGNYNNQNGLITQDIINNKFTFDYIDTKDTVKGFSFNSGKLVVTGDINFTVSSTSSEINYIFNQGYNCVATHPLSFVRGDSCSAINIGARAEGYSTQASGKYSTAVGMFTFSSGFGSYAQGDGSIADAWVSHAEGYSTTASGELSHSEGYRTSTSTNGAGAHAEGVETSANESGAHAEGVETSANGAGAHAEGVKTSANGKGAHAEGYSTTASGEDSHSEGYKTLAVGIGSFAGGIFSSANANYSIALGSHIDNNSASSVLIGSYSNGIHITQTDISVTGNLVGTSFNAFATSGEVSNISTQVSTLTGYFDAGITQNIDIPDVGGQNHHLEFTNGLLTTYTIE